MHPDNFNLVWVSKEAREIASKLVAEHSILQGYGMASYLSLPGGYDNHSAVQLWVHNKIQKWPPEYLSIPELNKAFLSCFPDHLLNSASH